MERRKLNIDSRIDYALILPVFLLSLIGFIALSISLLADYPAQAGALIWQQAAWLLVGMAAAFFVMHFDAKTLWSFAPILYGAGLLLMVVPIFVHSQVVFQATGARSWIGWGTTSLFQPSELMKIAYTLFLAKLIVDYRAKLEGHFISQDWMLVLRLTLASLPIIVLAYFQNDFGTLLVFAAIFFGMVLVSGVSWKVLTPILIFVGLIIVGIALLAILPNGLALLQKLGFAGYQSSRFEAWLSPFSDPKGSTYQQSQALIATAMGGNFGQGVATTNIAVPVRESDMIFTVIGGGTGFLGSSLVILLYLFLIYRMVRATYKANSQFYTFVAAGLTMMLLFHVFENIGATIGILPLTGIPLPFISQGGSNLISNMIGIGMILSIKYTEIPDFAKGKTRDKYRKKLQKRMEEEAKRSRGKIG